jgi:hypothetical protein
MRTGRFVFEFEIEFVDPIQARAFATDIVTGPDGNDGPVVWPSDDFMLYASVLGQVVELSEDAATRTGMRVLSRSGALPRPKDPDGSYPSFALPAMTGRGPDD